MMRSGRRRRADRSSWRIVISDALRVGRVGFESDPVTGDSEFGGILDRHHSLFGCDQAAKQVEQSGLTRSGPSADQNRLPVSHRP